MFRIHPRSFFVVLSIGFFVLPTFAVAQTAPLTQNLSLGMSGMQVKTLQTLLNSDSDTQIASQGAGSPGNETDYFGALTKGAVMRFQQKYANEVLAPVGLTAPNGFVGLYTRTKLTSIGRPCVTNCSVDSIHPLVPGQPLPVPGPLPSPFPIQSTNPNTSASETFMNDIEAAAAAQGLPAEAISAIKNKIIQKSATTTDLNAAFLDSLPKQASTAVVSLSPLQKVMALITMAFTKTFLPEHAYAITGTSFGGSLIFNEEICNEDSQYLIEITPHPPSYAVFLMYTPGTQKYSAQNIPNTSQVVGFYSGNTACVIGTCPYCYTFTTYGTIQSEVGSVQSSS